MTIQLDGSDLNLGESCLTLGWEVTRSLDPRYWLSSAAKAGNQSVDDLVRIPTHLLASHTAIIAQSGSGKSFFLGRLIEEILLQTSARCLIFDPNADFRRIDEAEGAGLWTNARYDPLKRKGKLPHENSQQQFSSRWSLITKRIRTGDGTSGNAYEPLQIWWPSLSMAFLAEDLDPMLQSDLYHCHTFVQEFADVFELKYSASQERKDFLEEAQGLFVLARAFKHDEKLRHTLMRDFSAEQIIKELSSKGFPTPRPGFVFVDPLVQVLRSKIELTTSTFIESGLDIANDVSPEVERFYFGKARLYQRAGILQTDVHGRAWTGSASKRLEVIDLPSLPDTSTRLLAIDSILTSEWDQARRNWRRALDNDARQDSRTPTFIIVDEAHNLIPKDPRSKAQIALREQFRTIVAEGRKYGLFLIIVSQRPDKLDPMILSECENKVLMKLGSASVLKLTSKILGLDDLPPKMLQKCLEFETGRALLVGSWCPDGPRIIYAAARRTLEGGRNLREAHWSVPLEITVLKLAPEAKAAAIALQTKCPEIVFRRGRWSVNQQARLMAGELLKNYKRASGQLDEEAFNRQRLYVTLSGELSLGSDGPVSARIRKQLQTWLDADTGAVTEEQIHDRLKESLAGMSDLEREGVSAHLTGYAFDIRPPATNAEEIQKYITSLPRFGYLKLETEGDERLWHIEFNNRDLDSGSENGDHSLKLS